MVQTVGFWHRLGASFLDFLLVALPISLLGMLLFNWEFDSNASSYIYYTYTLILPVLWSGYVVGKRLSGIRIVKKDGSNVTLFTMTMRVVVASIIYAATLGIGLVVSAIMVGVREDSRSIHDFIAGTYVTKALP